jgi:putative transposase
MLKVVTPKSQNSEVNLSLDEIAREGAKRMLVQALNFEVNEYVRSHEDLRDESGHRLVVRNGVAQERTVTMGSGAIKVEAPRVNDRRDGFKFTSNILPSYLRKSPKVESLLPLLYLKGLSTNNFGAALKEFFGEGTMGLSASSITSLTKIWDKEFNEWRKKVFTKNYVYIWADGVNVAIRLGEDKKLCLLVIIGADSRGEKEVLAVHAGYRESEDSWKVVLNDLIARGLKAPLLAIGDGALGFWAALRGTEELKNTKEQRCWVHKIANVLDKLPKRLQPQVKSLLHDMMRSESLSAANKVKKQFEDLLHLKFPDVVECLVKDWDKLTEFFNFPAQQWAHLRTTNPIESAFATVKLRTKSTKGAGSPEMAKLMAFKLLIEAQKKWRVLRGADEIKNLLEGVVYKDGIVVTSSNHHEVAAS